MATTARRPALQRHGTFGDVGARACVTVAAYYPSATKGGGHGRQVDQEQAQVRGVALERAMRAMARARQALHLDVAARHVIDGRIRSFLHYQGIAAVGDQLAIELDLHTHARRLDLDAMVGPLLEAGGGISHKCLVSAGGDFMSSCAMLK